MTQLNSIKTLLQKIWMLQSKNKYVVESQFVTGKMLE